MKPATFWKRLRGKWRLAWSLCPECNSDAPAMDTCQICDGRSPHRDVPEFALRATLRIWRLMFLRPRCPHGIPDLRWCSKCHAKHGERP